MVSTLRQASLLEDGDQVAVLDVAGAQHAVESGQPMLLILDVVEQRRAQLLRRHHDVLLDPHKKKHWRK